MLKEITDGDELKHVTSPGFVNEEADQAVGFVFGSPTEPRISLTFGRDKITVESEVYKEVGKSLFQPQPHPAGFKTERVDFACLTMQLEAAKRLHALLSQMISDAENQKSKYSVAT